MEFSKDDLKEAKRQIDSTLHKLRETIKIFESKENVERYKSQITLAKRRVKAFEIANWLTHCVQGVESINIYSKKYVKAI